MIKFTIPLNPVTKKNSQMPVFIGKKCPVCHKGQRVLILPSKAYQKYEKECKKHMPKVETIDRAVNVKALYYMKTKRRVDLTNLNEALHDVLVKYGVLADDNNLIVASTDGSRVLYDKENPRTEVEITEV